MIFKRDMHVFKENINIAYILKEAKRSRKGKQLKSKFLFNCHFYIVLLCFVLTMKEDLSI